MTVTGPDGEPLVLLPGMNCSARLWSGIDLGPALTPALTEPDLVQQVGRLLDAAAVPDSLWQVCPWAASWRWRWFAPPPSASARLCLLSTNPYGPTEQQLLGWRRERDRLANGTTAREIQHDLLPLLLTTETLQSRQDLVDTTLTLADEAEVDLDAQLALQATRIDERPGLRTVSRPTLVLAAREDRLCSVDRHREIAALVPSAELQILDRTAHLSPVERPDAVAAALSAWITGNGRSATGT